MWGDRFYNPKTKRVVGRKEAGGKLKPMFVQFALEPIWKLYDVAEMEAAGSLPAGTKSLAEMATALGTKVNARDLANNDR